MIVEPGLRWAAEHRDAPFLMTFLTAASHHPYTVPKGYEAPTAKQSNARDRYLRSLRYVDGVLEI